MIYFDGDSVQISKEYLSKQEEAIFASKTQSKRLAKRQDVIKQYGLEFVPEGLIKTTIYGKSNYNLYGNILKNNKIIAHNYAEHGGLSNLVDILTGGDDKSKQKDLDDLENHDLDFAGKTGDEVNLTNLQNKITDTAAEEIAAALFDIYDYVPREAHRKYYLALNNGLRPIANANKWSTMINPNDVTYCDGIIMQSLSLVAPQYLDELLFKASRYFSGEHYGTMNLTYNLTQDGGDVIALDFCIKQGR